MLSLRIVIFAKAPLPGLAKTRLIPALGLERSAGLARQLLRHTVHEALTARVGDVELCVAPDPQLPVWQELGFPDRVNWSKQVEGSLGQRMADAAQRVLSAGQSVLLIGTDCPELCAKHLQKAAQCLETHDACLVPVSDGGYILLGLNHFEPSLFSDIPWSTDTVAQLTEQRLRESGKTVSIMPTLDDVDEPGDLQWVPAHWLNAFE